MAEISKKQRKPVVQGKIYKIYQRTWGSNGRMSGTFIIVGKYVYGEFQKYTTKPGAVKGAERANWQFGVKKFRPFCTEKGWAVFQRMPAGGAYAFTPANLKDDNWWRTH
jgi:hypothetical protein